MHRRLVIFVIIAFGLLAGLPLLMNASQAVILRVPFVVQAPYGNWAQPYQDACEESVLVMLDGFMSGDVREKIPAHEADRRILDLVAYENAYLGFNRDTSLSDMKEMVDIYLPFEVVVVENLSLEQLIDELNEGRPVVAPIWGEYLKNSHFSAAGPSYHTILLVGYDPVSREFITHEPGTRFGRHFRYSFEDVMAGLQDFVPGDDMRPVWTDGLDRRVLFVRKGVGDYADFDGDADGLSKQQEMAWGTSLLRNDTDADGFDDGFEVAAGFSPVVDELHLDEGSVIKVAFDPRVYVLEGGGKRHILDEKSFKMMGLDWSDVIEVSERFSNSIPTY